MARPERLLMQAAWTYAQQVLPPDADYCATPTETNASNKIAAFFRKLMGVRAGEPDSRIIWRGRYTGLEFKAGASVSESQHRRHAELRNAGAETYIVRSISGLEAIWRGLGIPLRFHPLTPAMRDQMLAARGSKAKAAKPRLVRPDATAIRRVARMRRETMF